MHTLWAFTGRTCKSKTVIFSHHRNIHYSSIPHFALSAVDSWFPGASTGSATDPRAFAKRRKLEELLDSLSRDRPNPTRVWNVYLELGSVMGFGAVPFEIQQKVLQKCVPRAEQLRISAARRMQANNLPRSPHIYESRLQTLISHIRANGQRPTLDDYNFVLEQFAAVGHHTGAQHVFRELIYLGLQPSYRTYGLCLQAIAHRLTLPCPFRFRLNMYDEANSICLELLDDIWTRRVPMTSVNFDLAHRIFKGTDSRKTYMRLLKVGYGVDLANPDRPVLDKDSEPLAGNVPASSGSARTLPFTTAALNTLVDMLGSTKQVSQMVAAFEVLTNPLPPLPSSNSLSEDEDDNDPAFYQFAPTENVGAYQLPTAVPNTTTFNLLIRYTSKAKHAVFARHYVVQAMERDKEIDAQLRVDLECKPLGEIASPNFSVNRGTFIPPFGLANRTRHVAFLRWGFRQTILALKRKKEYLAFYTKWRQDHVVAPNPQTVGTVNDDQLQSTSYPHLSHDPSSKLTTEPDADPDVADRPPQKPEVSEVLQMDLNAPPPSPAVWKPLDLDLHISLLSRDVEEMRDLLDRFRAAVERLSQRVKEKLGRRVWRGKDIFIMSRNQRIHVGRREWMRIVNFRQPLEGVPGVKARVDGPRKHIPPHLDLRTTQRTPLPSEHP